MRKIIEFFLIIIPFHKWIKCDFKFRYKINNSQKNIFRIIIGFVGLLISLVVISILPKDLLISIINIMDSSAFLIVLKYICIYFLVFILYILITLLFSIFAQFFLKKVDDNSKDK